MSCAVVVKRVTHIKRFQSFFEYARKKTSHFGRLFYRVEHLFIALVRGPIFFSLGKFIRSHGSLATVVVIVFAVSLSNLYAQNDSETVLKGYWHDGSALLATNSNNDAQGLTLSDDALSNDTEQLAVDLDQDERKEAESTDIRIVADGAEDSLIDDSVDFLGRDSYIESALDKADSELYIVQNGDTVAVVAGIFGVDVNTILWANELDNPDDIAPGDTLLILPVSGIQHKVKSGDTLKSIAIKYEADEKQIIGFNGLPANGEITAGQKLIIPGGEIEVVKPKPVIAKKTSTRLLSRRTYVSGGSKGFAHPAPGTRRTQGIHRTNAVDLAAPIGTPVYAAAAGKVTKVTSGAWNGGYGRYIIITHNNGVVTLYAHLSAAKVKTGQKVSKGQRIGSIGSTGRSTGPHVHFEVRGARNPF